MDPGATRVSVATIALAVVMCVVLAASFVYAQTEGHGAGPALCVATTSSILVSSVTVSPTSDVPVCAAVVAGVRR